MMSQSISNNKEIVTTSIKFATLAPLLGSQFIIAVKAVVMMSCPQLATALTGGLTARMIMNR